MKGFIVVFLLLISPFIWGNDVIIKTNPRTYKINIETNVNLKGKGSSNTNLFLAFLGTNEYQKCKGYKMDELAKIVSFGAAGDSCVYYELDLGKQLALGKKVVLQNEFLLEVADVTVDFDAIDSIYPYNHNDPNYIHYTGSNLPFINVDQKQLLAISELILENSTGTLDYAKNCYLYVAKSFKYGFALSGFKSLEFTLKNRTGDCGNLSSVFITLLRMQNIPARHLIGFRPDGALHVWADFYLANYGWIPVDITYKKDYPEGDYFGNIAFADNGFIVQRGIGHEITVLESPMRITGLQTYTLQGSYTKPQKAKVYINRQVMCEIK